MSLKKKRKENHDNCYNTDEPSLREMKQASHKKTNTARFHFYKVSERSQIDRDKKQNSGCQGLEEWAIGSLMGIDFQICKMKKVQKLIPQQCKYI